jgi:hypothetical protein
MFGADFKIIWCGVQGSNLRPSGWQPDALPTELTTHCMAEYRGFEPLYIYIDSVATTPSSPILHYFNLAGVRVERTRVKERRVMSPTQLPLLDYPAKPFGGKGGVRTHFIRPYEERAFPLMLPYHYKYNFQPLVCLYSPLRSL